MSVEDYGTDISFEYDEIYADANTQSSDIGLVNGTNLLYQAIQNRLLTPLGTLPLHQNYGSRLHEIIGYGNSPLIEMTVKMYVAEALVPEIYPNGRIVLIRNIDVTFERITGTITVAVDIVSIYSTELQVITSIEG